MPSYFKPLRRRTPLRTTRPKNYGYAVPRRTNLPGKFGSYSATYDGRIYHSRKEALYAALLDTLKRAANPADRVVEWTPQVKVPFIVNGKLVANYYCDFVVRFADGRTEWHEVKGFETDVWLIKRKLFEACYPERVLRIIR